MLKINIKRKNSITLIEILLVFMYIFSFPIISIFDSSKVAGGILIIYMFFSNEYLNNMLKLLKKKYFLKINFIFLLIITWTFICQFLNSTFDLSFLKTFFNLYITIVIGFFLISFLQIRNKINRLVDLVILVFFIQTVIQWLCFFNRDFYEITSIFRSESLIRNYITYTGIRGLTISSTGFFGMAAAYGLVLILYVTEYNQLFRNKFFKVLVYIFIATGIFFSGRTGYIGLIISIFLLLYQKSKTNKLTKSSIKNSLIIISFILIAILLILSTKNNEHFQILYNYTFEPFENLISGEGFTATSLDSLKNMYIPIEGKTFFIGDGLYTTDTGYYLNTDVGYLRAILYFGIPGFLMLFILQKKLFLLKI